MFPILLLFILIISTNTRAVFVDHDAAKFETARKELMVKLPLALQIKSDFTELAANLDSLRKSNILKEPLDIVISTFSKNLSADNLSLMMDSLSTPATNVCNETTRLRAKFTALKNSSVALFSKQETGAKATTKTNLSLVSFLTGANNELTEKISTYLKLSELYEQKKLLKDTIDTYKRFADSIAKYNELAIDHFSSMGKDSLRYYLSALERFTGLNGIDEAYSEYSSYKDSLIDRIKFAPHIAAGKRWKDSLITYTNLRDSLRTTLEEQQKATDNSVKSQLSIKADLLRGSIAPFERMRDSLEKYSANPASIVEMSSTITQYAEIPILKNRLTEIKDNNYASIGREIALTIGRSYFPAQAELMDSAYKYFRILSNVKRYKKYKDSLSLAVSDSAKDIYRKKLLQTSGYEDSLKNIVRYRDSLIVKLPVPEWIGRGTPWQDSIRKYAVLKDSIIILRETIRKTPSKATELNPKIATYNSAITPYYRFKDSIAVLIENPELLIAYTPLAPAFIKLTDFEKEKRNLEQYIPQIQKHVSQGMNIYAFIDTFSAIDKDRVYIKRYFALNDTIQKYMQIKEKLLSEGGVLLMAFSGNLVSNPLLSNLLGTFSTLKSDAEDFLSGKKSLTDMAMSIGRSTFPKEASAIDSAVKYYKYAKYDYGKITAPKNLTDSVKAFVKYRDTLLNKLPIPDWIGKGNAWQDSLKRYRNIRDSVIQLQTDLKNYPEKTTQLEPILAEYTGLLNKHKQYYDTLKEYATNPEKLISRTPFASQFAKLTNYYTQFNNLEAKHRTMITDKRIQGENAYKTIDALSVPEEIKLELKRYISINDTIKKYEEMKERMFSDGTLIIMAFAGNAASSPFVSGI
ncbi:MAG: hypothetical protein JNL74_08055, partial [Fibrobacteres bacterium]|nr:hypothetical protein [Fibrobacterota bacterium]